VAGTSPPRMVPEGPPPLGESPPLGRFPPRVLSARAKDGPRLPGLASLVWGGAPRPPDRETAQVAPLSRMGPPLFSRGRRNFTLPGNVDGSKPSAKTPEYPRSCAAGKEGVVFVLGHLGPVWGWRAAPALDLAPPRGCHKSPLFDLKFFFEVNKVFFFFCFPQWSPCLCAPPPTPPRLQKSPRGGPAPAPNARPVGI